MMRTEDAVVAWIQNCLDGIDNLVWASSCHGDGNKFYSYSTPICKFYPCDKHFVLNPKKYSVTTTKLQNCLRRHLNGLNVTESEGLR